MASTRRPTASTQSRVVPLDAAEQDQVLRSRLSHTLSHRPLQGLKSKISLLASASLSSEAASPAYTLQRASLLADLQSYLLSLSRTSLITSSTASTQVQEYERQYDEIKAEEARSIQRIAGLKKQLAEVRRRRREKLEYGRVAESLEAWFKNVGGVGSGMEIEESLSNLLSHLTSSFLYNPSSTSSTEEASSSASASTSTTSPHAQNLSLLHAKIDEMLNLSRQVREIVGWKAGSGSSANGASNNGAGGGPASVAAAGQGQGQGRSRATSPGGRSTPALPSAGLLNPNARPFEPGSASSASVSAKRSRARPDDLYVSISSSSGPRSGGLASSDLEEGEEPMSYNAKSGGVAEGGKRRRVEGSRGAGGTGGREEGEADDDDEEGSILPAVAPPAAAAPAPGGGGGASTPSAPAGRGAQPPAGRRGLPARVVASSSGSGNSSGRGRGRSSRGR